MPTFELYDSPHSARRCPATPVSDDVAVLQDVPGHAVRLVLAGEGLRTGCEGFAQHGVTLPPKGYRLNTELPHLVTRRNQALRTHIIDCPELVGTLLLGCVPTHLPVDAALYADFALEVAIHDL